MGIGLQLFYFFRGKCMLNTIKTFLNSFDAGNIKSYAAATKLHSQWLIFNAQAERKSLYIHFARIYNVITNSTDLLQLSKTLTLFFTQKLFPRISHHRKTALFF